MGLPQRRTPEGPLGSHARIDARLALRAAEETPVVHETTSEAFVRGLRQQLTTVERNLAQHQARLDQMYREYTAAVEEERAGASRDKERHDQLLRTLSLYDPTVRCAPAPKRVVHRAREPYADFEPMVLSVLVKSQNGLRLTHIVNAVAHEHPETAVLYKSVKSFTQTVRNMVKTLEQQGRIVCVDGVYVA